MRMPHNEKGRDPAVEKLTVHSGQIVELTNGLQNAEGNTKQKERVQRGRPICPQVFLSEAGSLCEEMVEGRWLVWNM